MVENDIQVDFANLNYAFMKFQEQYKTLCQEVSNIEEYNLVKAIKKTKGFIYEYLSYVENIKLQDKIIDLLDKLTLDLINDKIYNKFKKINNRLLKETIYFNKRYYFYLIKLFNIIGLFGDELSNTFMPNKSDRQKLFKYRNNNSFFEQFTNYKSNSSKELSDFNILKFKRTFNSFMGFYFAYYLFVDENSRNICNNTFSNILNIYLDEDIVKLIKQDYNNLTQDNKNKLKEYDSLFYSSLITIFYRLNYSYSTYGVMPKMNKFTNIDRTTI